MQLDPGREEAVADRVGRGPFPRGPRTFPFRQQPVYEGPDQIRGVARAVDRQLPEAHDRGPQGRSRDGKGVRLLGVARPRLDRLLERQDGSNGGRDVASVEGRFEDAFEVGDLFAERARGRRFDQSFGRGRARTVA